MPPTSNGDIADANFADANAGPQGLPDLNADPNTNIGAQNQDTNPYALRTFALTNTGQLTDPVSQIQVTTNLQIMAPGDDA